MKNNKKHTFTFAYQQPLRPELPTYFVPKEYREFRDALIEVNRILESGIEHQFIVKKMEDAGIEQLPNAIWQAHERIIGERRVDNREKILSFYEPDVRVMVRGKSGAEVEFGNALYLVENHDGLIVDWKFLKEQAPSDSALVKESIERVSGNYGKPDSYVANRGFSSKPNSEYLHEEGIYDAICPKSVNALSERLEEPRFRELQRRRAGTEARIGIFKNGYSGCPLRSKGFDHRDNRIGWCILAHNLWKLASIDAENRRNQDGINRLIA
jgi:hypothetical protein